MIINDADSQYSAEKKVKWLLVRMADLSKYKNNIWSHEISGDDLSQYLVDEELFEAGLAFIFSEPYYLERVSSAFRELSIRQKINFYLYYCSFSNMALNQGFLSKYESLQKKIRPLWWPDLGTVVLGLFGIWLLLNLNDLQKQLLGVCLIGPFFVKPLLENGNVSTKEQADLIIGILKRNDIEYLENWAKTVLIGKGWLNGQGKLVAEE